MTIATSQGFAVVDDDGINMRTASPTRRAAIVNWLVGTGRRFISTSHSEEDIENMWQADKGGAEVLPITVQAIIP